MGVVRISQKFVIVFLDKSNRKISQFFSFLFSDASQLADHTTGINLHYKAENNLKNKHSLKAGI